MAVNYTSSAKQLSAPSTASIQFHLELPLPTILPVKPPKNSSNPLPASMLSKSSLNYPSIVTRSTKARHTDSCERKNAPLLCIINTPFISYQTNSAPSSFTNLDSLSLHQQSHTDHHYGHFLAYLRRKSLSRSRRKQHDEENTETTVSFSSTKSSSQVFHSSSNISLGTSSVLTIPSTLKQKSPSSSHRQMQRSSSLIPTNYRLNQAQSPSIRHSSLLSTKQISDDHQLVVPSLKTMPMTSTNSTIDRKTPYDLYLNGNILSYCYMSDSGVIYQGQLLSTPVS